LITQGSESPVLTSFKVKSEVINKVISLVIDLLSWHQALNDASILRPNSLFVNTTWQKLEQKPV